MTAEATKANFLVRVFRFYVNGFRSMTLGKTLWLIILIKLFIMFAILKLFFFPNYLKGKGDKDDRARYVQQELIDRSAAD
ncbi:membrane protein [Porphyromonas crevioricanis]|uniref:Membrane protein n=2 Tax=Porphyromonas crevioricanis TaxID=393921 RepID=A0A0A2FWL7_9PORP|nr:DUF4492 domain-containing protein [Porphyromonas crevioricanis]KGN90288.1 membrane protein [Porphyromonas crevioricanis]KGN95371.1 membrane protein [Porphyromonas crevioricanis]SKA04203.1 protein of unknown function [Porphyromonas crevioricanis]SQH72727.1 Uncharacterised protein [Porphyromonas crevioricanis]GAD08084.1 hypothetical protein PORCAN_1719 [Porphyromonas crevioricanis JCM 13913]